MSKKISFKGFSIISCGTLKQEIQLLSEQGFLDADKIIYTAPGLHEIPHQLEIQLKKQIDSIKKEGSNIIIVYGTKCYVDFMNPLRGIDELIQEAGIQSRRVNAKNCIDMFVNLEERDTIRNGQKVYWLSPGWIIYWKAIFKDWDQGKANETFPQYDKAILLDSIGLFDQYSIESPEKILEFSDWMHLNIESHQISLNRFKKLLSEATY